MLKTSDRRAFIKAFGVPVKAASGARFSAIYDEPYSEALGVSGQDPQIDCEASDVEHLGRDDVLTVRGVEYRIAAREADGDGFVLLRLRKL